MHRKSDDKHIDIEVKIQKHNRNNRSSKRCIFLLHFAIDFGGVREGLGMVLGGFRRLSAPLGPHFYTIFECAMRRARKKVQHFRGKFRGFASVFAGFLRAAGAQHTFQHMWLRLMQGPWH